MDRANEPGWGQVAWQACQAWVHEREVPGDRVGASEVP